MASGDVYTDTITLGDITIQNQDIELASKLSASFLQGGSDGLLGLAWPSVRICKSGHVFGYLLVCFTYVFEDQHRHQERRVSPRFHPGR
jgi:hypothetical protein